MNLTIEDADNGVTVATLDGKLDVAGAGEIELRFNAAAGARRALVVDLSGVSFIASMGVRLLLVVARTVANKGGRIALAAPMPEVASVLLTARIDGVVPILRTREAAILAVAPN